MATLKFIVSVTPEKLKKIPVFTREIGSGLPIKVSHGLCFKDTPGINLITVKKRGDHYPE